MTLAVAPNTAPGSRRGRRLSVEQAHLEVDVRQARLTRWHAALDRAVWAAHGWDDAEPGETSDETILARLLALDGERERQ